MEFGGFHFENSKEDGTQSTIPYICRLKLSLFDAAIQ
jgi:hypothetical protein